MYIVDDKEVTKEEYKLHMIEVSNKFKEENKTNELKRRNEIIDIVNEVIQKGNN